MRFTPDTGDTIAHAERALTGFYPCLPSGPEFAASLRELIWRDHGSLGPSVVNVACPSLQFTSKRDGEVWSQSYAYGVPSGPAEMLGSTETTGTIIDFRTEAAIDRAAVATLVDALQSLAFGVYPSRSNRPSDGLLSLLNWTAYKRGAAYADQVDHL